MYVGDIFQDKRNGLFLEICENGPLMRFCDQAKICIPDKITKRSIKDLLKTGIFQFQNQL